MSLKQAFHLNTCFMQFKAHLYSFYKLSGMAWKLNFSNPSSPESFPQITPKLYPLIPSLQSTASRTCDMLTFMSKYWWSLHNSLPCVKQQKHLSKLSLVDDQRSGDVSRADISLRPAHSSSSPLCPALPDGLAKPSAHLQTAVFLLAWLL